MPSGASAHLTVAARRASPRLPVVARQVEAHGEDVTQPRRRDSLRADRDRGARLRPGGASGGEGTGGERQSLLGAERVVRGRRDRSGTGVAACSKAATARTIATGTALVRRRLHSVLIRPPQSRSHRSSSAARVRDAGSFLHPQLFKIEGFRARGNHTEVTARSSTTPMSGGMLDELRNRGNRRDSRRAVIAMNRDWSGLLRAAHRSAGDSGGNPAVDRPRLFVGLLRVGALGRRDLARAHPPELIDAGEGPLGARA